MTVRGLLLVTHRWVGLASCFILAITGGTGAFMVWPGFLPGSLVRRAIGRLHETLALGRPGAWIVLGATIAAVLLQVTGIVLWWRRKAVAVQLRGGWRRAMNDLHHSAGVVALVIMLVLAVSGVGMVFITPDPFPDLRKVIVDWHTARAFPFPIKVLYTAGTLGFAVQGFTGLIMWWRPRGRSSA
jgi:uncharacterized iron-regulated membrane protein